MPLVERDTGALGGVSVFILFFYAFVSSVWVRSEGLAGYMHYRITRAQGETGRRTDKDLQGNDPEVFCGEESDTSTHFR